jgi:hypothetical protein
MMKIAAEIPKLMFLDEFERCGFSFSPRIKGSTVAL